jgi:photosystem II stability/assembly factor-like uncharacterized protein
MKRIPSLLQTSLCLLALGAGLIVTPATRAEPPPPRSQPALRGPQALTAPLLAGACAGTRQVAVGDHGVVLWSDDAGSHWQQARQVPTDVVLTSVSFADRQHGWAVGHWGTVLVTNDGGDTWVSQRQDISQDRPLFAVHFFDAQEGVAVGLWSQVLITHDGGQHWEEGSTGLTKASGQADLNLYSLFSDAQQRLYATAERGMVLRSADRGQHWEALSTGHRGSLWTGLALPQGRLLVGGLRGALWSSDDDGQHWQATPGERADSVHHLAVSGQTVLAVGANGKVWRSQDGGSHVSADALPERSPLTAALRCRSDGTAWTVLSAHGPVPLPR